MTSDNGDPGEMQFDQALSLRSETLVDRVILYIATALFTMTILLATVQVLVRFLGLDLFGLAHWTEPAARYVLIIATYLGAAVASRNNEHIKMEYVLDRFEASYPYIRQILDILVATLVVVFVVVALRGTVINAATSQQIAIGGIGFVTAGILYLGIAAGLSIMLLYEMLTLSDRMKTVLRKEEID